MEDTKTQLLAVVNNLSNEAVKQNLAAKINSAEISEELITEVRQAVQQAITDYETKMVEELDKAENQIQTVLDEYQKTLKTIAKEENKKQDQSQIEDIRKKLQ
jgi:hypothetical protein